MKAENGYPYTEHQQQVLQRLLDLSGISSGSLMVLGELYRKYGSCVADLVEEEGIRGSEIFAVYKYYCNEELGETFRSIALGEASKWIENSPYRLPREEE